MKTSILLTVIISCFGVLKANASDDLKDGKYEIIRVIQTPKDSSLMVASSITVIPVTIAHEGGKEWFIVDGKRCEMRKSKSALDPSWIVGSNLRTHYGFGIEIYSGNTQQIDPSVGYIIGIYHQITPYGIADGSFKLLPVAKEARTAK